MSASDVAIAAWSGGAAAVLAAFVGLWPWMTRNVNHRAFAEQIGKLLRAGNTERAIKLCGAAPQSPVANAIGRCLSQRKQVPEGAMGMRNLYLQTLQDQMAGARRLVPLSGLALAIDAVVVYLVSSRDAPVASLSLVVLALLGLFSAQGLVRKISREGTAVGDALYELMATAP